MRYHNCKNFSGGFLKETAIIMVLLFLASPAAKAQMETGVDLVESASKFGQIQYFHTLVVETGLEELLKEEGPFTIFAPTDRAFNEMDQEVLEGLLENPEELREILRAHISSGTTMAGQLGEVDNIPMIEGSVFEVEHGEQGTTIGGAKLVAADVVATNGAIHAIDTVLMP